MERIEKGRALILCALLCTVIIAIIGIKDAKNINAETPEETAVRQVKEITIVTVTPKKVEAQEYIDFDLRNLSIVRKEWEEDVVNNSGTQSDGEPATVTEDSGRDESGTQGYSDDNSGDEYSVGEAAGSEMADSGQEQWSEPEDIVSDDGDGEPESELADAETSDKAGSEGSVDGEPIEGDTDNDSNEQYGDTEYSEDSGDGWIYYANARITHYCPFSCCCGEYATGYTANGSLATPNHTVASGEDLPFGTEVLINGQVYVVEDRGVNPGEIDIFVSDHDTALAMGLYYTDVYVRYPEG